MADSNAKKLAQFLTASGTYNLYDVQADSTGFFDLPSGTTAQRPGTPLAGMIRFNTTVGKAEQYDGTSWQSIDGPPVLSSINPSAIASSDGSFDITLTGDNFSTNSTVVAIGQDASEISPTTVVRTDAQELVATFDGTEFDNAQEPYAIKVTNNTGLASTLGDSLQVDASPVWTTASGSIGSIYDSARGSVSLSVSATDPESGSITYSVTTGSLPTGLSLNSSTGAITGSVSAVGSDTTTNFSITASDGSNDNERAFSITVKAPVVTSYTSVGSGTFSVPTGTTAVDVLVVAGGGAGGKHTSYGGGGGGAGGLIYRPAFPVTPGGSVSYSVGGGGPGGDGPPSSSSVNKGQNSTFGGLTALGGGAGNSTASPWNNASLIGGSGGGACYSPGSPLGGFTPTVQTNGWTNPQNAGGSGQQPSQPGDSGTYGFGYPGGDGNGDSGQASGGGGAGGAGVTYSGNNSPQLGGNGHGGIGRSYDISGSSVAYAGGGGGGGYSVYGQGGTGGGGHGGTSGEQGGQGQADATSATANRGGGGGGSAASNGPSAVGNGGSGIVIVKY
jgi:hypothetical protein